MRHRAAIMRALLAVSLLVVMARMWQLQVVEGAALYKAALDESRRVVTIPAPRGKILDRNGIVLATDVAQFAAELTANGQPPSPQEQALLENILGISPTAMAAAVKALYGSGQVQPVVLRNDLTPEEYTELAQDRPSLPGVKIISQPMRIYPGIPGDRNPGQELAANLIGFIKDGAVPGTVTGAAGIEASYNGPQQLPGGGTVPGLQGSNGEAYLVVGRNGAVQQQRLIPPVPGDNVVLTINAKLQAVLQRALTDQMAALRTRYFSGEGGPYPNAYAGAAVVIDVNNGQVLAAASEPTFNPNAFAQATLAAPGSAAAARFAAQYQAWATQPGEPFVDHVVSDVAPPGSTFKPITAIAALESGVITPAERLPCPPYIQLAPGYVLHNWIPVFDGYLNLTQAIAQSCDTYFYRVGAQTGIQAIDRVAAEFGLGQLTGQHALYGEDPGQMSSPAVEPKSEGPWTPALTMQSAIGQGFSDFNPLEMADYVAALANGGTLWRPYFVLEITAPDGKVLIRHEPQVRRHIPLSPAIVQAIHTAMEGTVERVPAWYQDGVTSDWGTAYWPFYDFTAETQQYLGKAITVAGKTGTAQVVPGQTSDGWFISFAPVNHPQIAVVVFIHHANEGFASGAPIVREVYDYYFGLDKAMWRAGAAANIIPGVVQGYFGQSNQIPDWWPATPPPPSASSTHPTASASSGTNSAHATPQHANQAKAPAHARPAASGKGGAGTSPAKGKKGEVGKSATSSRPRTKLSSPTHHSAPAASASAAAPSSSTTAPGGVQVPPSVLCQSDWLMTLSRGKPIAPTDICVPQGAAARITFVATDGHVHDVLISGYRDEAVVPASGTPVTVAFAADTAGTFTIQDQLDPAETSTLTVVPGASGTSASGATTAAPPPTVAPSSATAPQGGAGGGSSGSAPSSSSSSGSAPSSSSGSAPSSSSGSAPSSSSGSAPSSSSAPAARG
jgi:penicillin-binding protein 2